MSEDTRVVEINGVKVEVDLRKAKTVQTIRVGSKVKLLVKGYQTSADIYPGIVVGFEEFQSLPTVLVCYLSHNYNSAKLEFASINEKTADKYEMVASVDEELPVAKADILSALDKDIAKAYAEAESLELKRNYFLKHFNKYFEEVGVI